MYKHKKLPTPTNPPVNTSKMLRMRKERIASAQLRHDMIQANKRQNYINEYDRINGILSNNIAHGHISAAYLTNRKEKLNDLFEQSFKEQMHELYNKYNLL